MDLFQILNDVIFSSVEGFITLLVFMLLNNHKDFLKQNKLKSFIFPILYMFVSYLCQSFVPVGIHTITLFVFTISILSFIMKLNLYAALITQIITILFFSILEVPVLIALMALYKVDLAHIVSSPELKLLANIVVRSICLVLILPLFYARINIFKFNIFKKESSFLSLLLLQMSTVTIIITASPRQGNSILYYIILFIAYLLIIVIGILEFKERTRLMKMQNKFLAQEEYVKNMEIVVDIIRKEKHDFANHINTLMAMCLLKKPDTLESIEQYARKLVNHTGSSYKFYKTGNVYVDGLLAIKSNFACENSINFDVDFDAPLNQIAVDDIDLTSILGNIIDNAFDAITMHSPHRNGIVAIYTYIEQDKYYISISNNGVKISEANLDKIFENKFTTKSKPGSVNERGYGLYITRQLISKNNGKISVTSSEQETEFLIEFNVKSLPKGENLLYVEDKGVKHAG